MYTYNSYIENKSGWIFYWNTVYLATNSKLVLLMYLFYL